LFFIELGINGSSVVATILEIYKGSLIKKDKKLFQKKILKFSDFI
jgi:hypothetical protein